MATNTGTHNRKKISLVVRTKQINKMISAVNCDRLDIAYLLQDTNRNTHWRTTKWGSFRQYCTAELYMSYGSIGAYLACVNKAERLGYTSVQLRSFLQFISWSALLYLVASFNKKHTKAEVVTLFKAGKLQYTVTTNSGSEDFFRFSLPVDHADKFTGILIAHGMALRGTTRKNVRQAMMAFLDTQP